MRRMQLIRAPFLSIGLGACLALGACSGGGETAGNTVEMRDLEVVEGTVNDSMTDLDAVNLDGVGTANNASGMSRAPASGTADEPSGEGTETVAAE